MSLEKPQPTPELSVVILCYQEQDRIPERLEQIEAEVRALGIPYEIILVVNYFPDRQDRSPQIALELGRKNPRIKPIVKPKEGMMGWDMRMGLEAARGDLLAVLDGDGQIPPNDIVRVYRELRARDLDVCQTFRAKREDGRVRTLISRIYNSLFRILFPGTPVHDVNAKPKIMKREAYQLLRLSSRDWFIDAEILIQARWNRLRIGEIPSVFGKSHGRASYITGITLLEFIKNLILFRIREFSRR
ncbi:MAG: glycosyltransferase family 2 protein [Candidatus Omnitrophica bacterium]|nr:glycosyltransferase family 2 protein [Candidatus Omnitrophota bacterium]